MSLFRFPCVHKTEALVASMAATISLVVVLPLLPVMPTTDRGSFLAMESKRRHSPASSANANRESSTIICANSVFTPSWIIAAIAPAF